MWERKRNRERLGYAHLCRYHTTARRNESCTNSESDTHQIIQKRCGQKEILKGISYIKREKKGELWKSNIQNCRPWQYQWMQLDFFLLFSFLSSIFFCLFFFYLFLFLVAKLWNLRSCEWRSREASWGSYRAPRRCRYRCRLLRRSWSSPSVSPPASMCSPAPGRKQNVH